jgi:hypothetical protein
MEVVQRVNFVLIPLTHWFCFFRMPEMAIVNMLALYSMNYNTKNKSFYVTLNLLNGIITYIMGYTHFLRNAPSSGVYSFVLGVACMTAASQHTLSSILADWNSNFRIRTPPQKVVESEEEEFEDEEEEEEVTPAPAPAEPPIYRAPEWAPIYKEELPSQPVEEVETPSQDESGRPKTD